MVFNRFVSKRSLLQLLQRRKYEVRLDIDQQYAEEQIIIEAPSLSPRVQKVQDFVQSLDKKETLKGKFQDQVYLIQISKIQRVYIENRKVLAERIAKPMHLTFVSTKQVKFYLLPLSKFPIGNCQH